MGWRRAVGQGLSCLRSCAAQQEEGATLQSQQRAQRGGDDELLATLLGSLCC